MPQVFRAIGSALLLALLSVLPAAANAPQQFQLDNGLQVIVIEDHRAPVVVHMVWYRAGAADDPAGVSGIAHYFEHLMFKATDTMEEGAFQSIVEANGGELNAFTSWDFTAYYERVAADRLELMMRMEAERMTRLRLGLSDWETERAVILRERGQTLESNPNRQFGEQMRAALFQNHPYGRPILGWRHEMEQLSDVSAEAFYRTHYAPNNAILVVAGDVEAEDVVAMAREIYGAIPTNPAVEPRQRPTEPPQLAERRVIMEDSRVAQPYMSRIYLAPTRHENDQRSAAALTVLGALLGGNEQTSVFGRQLTLDQGVTLATWAGYGGGYLDHGTFSLGAMPTSGVSLQQAEDALDSALAQFIETGVDTAHLARVRTQLRAEAIYELDDTESRANTIGGDLAIGLTLAESQNWIDVLQSVTEDEIIAAARSLDRRASVTGWLMGETQ